MPPATATQPAELPTRKQEYLDHLDQIGQAIDSGAHQYARMPPEQRSREKQKFQGFKQYVQRLNNEQYAEFRPDPAGYVRRQRNQTQSSARQQTRTTDQAQQAEQTETTEQPATNDTEAIAEARRKWNGEIDRALTHMDEDYPGYSEADKTRIKTKLEAEKEKVAAMSDEEFSGYMKEVKEKAEEHKKAAEAKTKDTKAPEATVESEGAEGDQIELAFAAVDSAEADNVFKNGELPSTGVLSKGTVARKQQFKLEFNTADIYHPDYSKYFAIGARHAEAKKWTWRFYNWQKEQCEKYSPQKVWYDRFDPTFQLNERVKRMIKVSDWKNTYFYDNWSELWKYDKKCVQPYHHGPNPPHNNSYAMVFVPEGGGIDPNIESFAGNLLTHWWEKSPHIDGDHKKMLCGFYIRMALSDPNEVFPTEFHSGGEIINIPAKFTGVWRLRVKPEGYAHFVKSCREFKEFVEASRTMLCLRSQTKFADKIIIGGRYDYFKDLVVTKLNEAGIPTYEVVDAHRHGKYADFRHDSAHDIGNAHQGGLFKGRGDKHGGVTIEFGTEALDYILKRPQLQWQVLLKLADAIRWHHE